MAEDQEPGNQKLLGIAVVLVLVVGSFALAFGPSLMRSNEAKRLAQEGLAANATILSLSETGNVYNDKPEVAIRIRVEPDAGEAFEAEVVTVLGPVDLQTYVLGAILPVHYDPQDRSAVAIAGPPRLPEPDAKPAPGAQAPAAVEQAQP